MILHTADAKGSTYKTEKAAYQKVRRAEIQYGVKLRKIAENVGLIVKSFAPGDPAALPKINELLRKYADLVRPWAVTVSASMLAEVNQRDEQAWNDLSKNMGAALREEMLKAPTGDIFRALQLRQVNLITSIPLEAAQRIHTLTMEGLVNPRRAAEIRDDILRTTHVTKSRATLIARTEVGRVSSNLAQARAVYVGSDGYIWRTSRDDDVRKSHKQMEGKFVRWNQPPILDNLQGHAGCVPNCRCYPEIVVPDIFRSK